jgi:hypothetical protein
MVPNQNPPDLYVNGILSPADKEAMVKHLITRQKTKAEWDVYRKKIADELLEKWERVLNICREQGFINPHIINEKIIWNRVLSQKRSQKSNDKCTLCDKTYTSGECEGQMIYNSKEKRETFVPCWTGGN